MTQRKRHAKPRGRPPLGAAALTAGERQRRWRARRGQINKPHLAWVMEVLDEVMGCVVDTALHTPRGERHHVEMEVMLAKWRIIAALEGRPTGLEHLFALRAGRAARSRSRARQRAVPLSPGRE
jgi:hypothetical protein